MKRIAFALALVVVVATAGCKQQEETAVAPVAPPKTVTSPVGVDVGAMLPSYTATWLDGSKLDLAGERGKVVLLNLWATWCGPCRFEIPELQRMHDQYASRGFEVIGVSVDEGGVAGVKQFIAEQKMTYPIALDPDGKLANLLQTSVLPTSVVLDRKGKIVWKRYGLIVANDQELKEAIEKAL